MSRVDRHPVAEPAADQVAAEVNTIQAEITALGATNPFAAAVQATRMPMLITNPRLPDNPIVFVNASFCTLSGYAHDEIVGRNCRFLQGPATDLASVTAMRESIKAGHSIEIDVQNYRKDGTTFWNRLLIAPVHDADGNLIYFFASQLDITMERERLAFLQNQNQILEDRVAERTRDLVAVNTKLREEAAERQRVEGALRHAQKMEAIGQLTGGIAHDFNNMLQSIITGIEIAQRRVAAGNVNKVGEVLESAMAAGRRAAELTRRLLAFGRKQALSPKRLVVDELAQGMATIIQQTVGPAITVKLRLQEGCWPVHCDPNQLENAVLNLAINARDAMLPAGGLLLIETANVTLDRTDTETLTKVKPGDYVQITVTDTGTGMTPDVMSHAFEPFFTTKPDGQGTGLGLSQIDGFMHQSSGVARLESRVGFGTSVHLYIPRLVDGPAVHATQPADLPQDAITDTSEGTILLVEDESTVRELTALTLRETGYQVLEACDGHEALTLLEEPSHRASLDLLVADVGLPGGLNGRQLAEKAREMLPELPILLITGYTGTVDISARNARSGSAIEVLNKPFELSALSARVQALLSRQRSPARYAGPPSAVSPGHMPR